MRILVIAIVYLVYGELKGLNDSHITLELIEKQDFMHYRWSHAKTWHIYLEKRRYRKTLNVYTFDVNLLNYIHIIKLENVEKIYTHVYSKDGIIYISYSFLGTKNGLEKYYNLIPTNTFKYTLVSTIESKEKIEILKRSTCHSYEIEIKVCYNPSMLYLLYKIDFKENFKLIKLTKYIQNQFIIKIIYSKIYQHSTNPDFNKHTIYITTSTDILYRFNMKNGQMKQLFSGVKTFFQVNKFLFIVVNNGLKLFSNNGGDNFNQIYFMDSHFDNVYYNQKSLKISKFLTIGERVLFFLKNQENTELKADIFISDIYANKYRPITNITTTDVQYVHSYTVSSMVYIVHFLMTSSNTFLSFDNGDSWNLISISSDIHDYRCFIDDYYAQIGTIIMTCKKVHKLKLFLSFDGGHMWNTFYKIYNIHCNEINTNHNLKLYFFIGYGINNIYLSLTGGQSWKIIKFQYLTKFSFLHYYQSKQEEIYFIAINTRPKYALKLKFREALIECDKSNVTNYVRSNDERMIYKRTNSDHCYSKNLAPLRNITIQCHHLDVFCDFNYDRIDTQCVPSRYELISKAIFSCINNLIYQFTSYGYKNPYNDKFYEKYCKSDKFKLKKNTKITKNKKCDYDSDSSHSIYQSIINYGKNNNYHRIRNTIILSVFFFMLAIIALFFLSLTIKKFCFQGFIKNIVFSNTQNRFIKRSLIQNEIQNQDNGNVQYHPLKSQSDNVDE
ncbi:hypothetical protein A3Q56_03586 [Intoshia linei]|uniref:VPS10 domain-containing protein n=1 Tax=Intoshia linei TaxID=1819745 RepID=A0A177B4K0_9BILA|nr:hypothetical protein A3Q56_03586 [Intoshia linei]